jgi:O-antigen/teichoic acid export membrane protein
MLKKIFSHSIIYGLAPQIPKIINLLILPIITQYLTEEDFGVAGLIGSVVASIAIFANLGLNVTLSNTFYKCPGSYHWGWRQIYGFLILWNFPFAILMSILISLFIPDVAKVNSVYIILLNVIPIVFFGPTATIGNLFFQLKQKPIQIGLRILIIGLIGVLLNLVFIAHLKLGYMGWFLAGGISSMLMQISYWIPINLKYNMKPIFNFKWRYIKTQLKVAVPTIPHYYGSYLLSSSDKLLMGALNISIGNLGKYNAAGQIANNGSYVGEALGKALGPIMLKNYKDKKENINRLIVFMMQIIFLVGSFVICLWMKEIMAFFIRNETLKSVYPLAIIMTMAYNYRPMYLGAVNKIMYMEKTTKLMNITLTAGIFSVTLNFIFIPIMGIQASALILFIGFMYMGYSGYYLKVFRESSTFNYHPLFWLITTVISTILVYNLVHIDMIYKIAFSVFLILFGTISVLIINKKIRAHEQKSNY